MASLILRFLLILFLIVPLGLDGAEAVPRFSFGTCGRPAQLLPNEAVGIPQQSNSCFMASSLQVLFPLLRSTLNNIDVLQQLDDFTQADDMQLAYSLALSREGKEQDADQNEAIKKEIAEAKTGWLNEQDNAALAAMLYNMKVQVFDFLTILPKDMLLPCDDFRLNNLGNINGCNMRRGQHDVTEFLQRCIRAYSLISNDFAFQVQEVKSHAGGACASFQPAVTSTTLELPIVVAKRTSLDILLQSYFALEALENGATGWQCPGKVLGICEHQENYKQMKMASLPNILVMTLKRFETELQQPTEWDMWLSKITGEPAFPRIVTQKIFTPVDCPLTDLDLIPYSTALPDDAPMLYDAHAFIIHEGTLPTNGHYYAYVKRNGRWLLYNDAMVHEVADATAQLAIQHAYVVIYKKQEFVLSPDEGATLEVPEEQDIQPSSPAKRKRSSSDASLKDGVKRSAKEVGNTNLPIPVKKAGSTQKQTKSGQLSKDKSGDWCSLM